MSSKKLKKFGDIKISAQSLAPPEKDGWLTKQGGSIKTWNKRYFILKDNVLYYFKTPKDQEITGRIDLEGTSMVQEEPSKGKKGQAMFSVSTTNRVFYMFPDKPEEMKDWVDAIKTVIERQKNAPPKPASVTKTLAPQKNDANVGPREKLHLAKNAIKFLNEPGSKVLIFWNIWLESLPDRKELATIADGYMTYQVAVSADMNKLTWRVSGPQSSFIQKMVDFFWAVGAPEIEIDRLNDVGATINPDRIGSWIDMSAKGGMDGGWYFPVKIPVEDSVQATDKGENDTLSAAITKLLNWCKQRDITQLNVIGRDMGAAPPRQTEMRFKLPGMTFEEQLECAMSAWTAFEVPAMPEEAIKILKTHTGPTDLTLSVVTSVDGFVRIGILVAKPSVETVVNLSKLPPISGNRDNLAAFEGFLVKDGPDFVEYQHLFKGYGYGVYKEGFDVVFHYDLGIEAAE